MRIVFAAPESPYADEPGCGIAAYLRAIIPAVASAGHRVTVIAGANEEKSFKAENGQVSVDHFRLPSLHWHAAKIPGLKNLAPLPLRQLEWSRAFYRRVARVRASSRIDVIESTEVGALFLSRIAPLVVRLHGSERIFREQSCLPVTASVKWSDMLEASACESAAAITSPSAFHANETARRRGWANGRVQVIPNPICQSVLQAAAAFHGNDRKERIALYCGRIAPVKGIETLFEAANVVRTIDRSIKFVLAGPWQMSKSPASYGLTGDDVSTTNVRWLGPLRHEELIDWYKRAAVLVVPSNYETFGLTAIEAVAFGTPVIATQGNAITETLGQSGFVSFVPRADPLALATAVMQRFVANEKSEGVDGTAVERYFPGRVAEETLKLYRAITTRQATN